MATNIVIQIPNNLFGYHTQLRDFFEGMIMKLSLNAHKKTPTTADIPFIIDLLQQEIIEFEDQFARNKYDENTLIELMDAANFAFLAYVACRLQGIKHVRNKVPTDD